ncbi:hypothetical protein UFOVP724_143 [uncultured Caudovirales phage]|uniref:Uncharacterized protein n=1 Tax=uncultured Caudovirales phage TaxID=2100421 RepID=A0A6J5NRN1_9CAUD|nr:hypothetical protein UFOVP724_143 [uncultured Caudovirales phage]
MIDPNNANDKIVLNRIANLEERVRDLTIAHQKFVTNSQINEMIVHLTNELATVKLLLASIEKRITILEES